LQLIQNHPSLTMKLPWIAAALTLSNPAISQTFITSGHVDIGIGYADNAFDLHVHQEEPLDQEFAPGEAVFAIGPAAAGLSPGGAFTGFLGATGTPVWVLRTTENEQLPFLGFGTEELTASDWSGNITLSLKAVSGPGTFSIWGTSGFGAPELKMSTIDGITAGDRLPLVPGSHGHFNVGFSAPGDYSVTLEASGTHLIDGLRTSDPATYRFQVIPEPATWALALTGAGVGILALRRRWPKNRGF
jgi:surface-anchored protein